MLPRHCNRWSSLYRSRFGLRYSIFETPRKGGPSSVGRAPALQAGSQGFESPCLHSVDEAQRQFRVAHTSRVLAMISHHRGLLRSREHRLPACGRRQLADGMLFLRVESRQDQPRKLSGCSPIRTIRVIRIRASIQCSAFDSVKSEAPRSRRLPRERALPLLRGSAFASGKCHYRRQNSKSA